MIARWRSTVTETCSYSFNSCVGRAIKICYCQIGKCRVFGDECAAFSVWLSEPPTGSSIVTPTKFANRKKKGNEGHREQASKHMKSQKPRSNTKKYQILAHPIPRLLSKLKRHTLSTNALYSSMHYTKCSSGNLNYDTANLTAAARLTLLPSHRRVYGPMHHLTQSHCPEGCKAV
jgi:hypothetical protein